MAFDPEYLDLMPHRIVVNPYLSFNAYGERSYSTSGSTYDAMVQEQPTKVLNQIGEEVIGSHVVYVASTSRLDITARYTLPDGSQPTPIRVDVMSDEDGIHHNVVIFGPAN